MGQSEFIQQSRHPAPSKCPTPSSKDPDSSHDPVFPDFLQEKLGNGHFGTVYKISETKCMKIFDRKRSQHDIKNELEKNRLLGNLDPDRTLALVIGVPDFVNNHLTMDLLTPLFPNHKIRIPDHLHQLLTTLLFLHKRRIALFDIKWQNFLCSLSE